MELKELQKCDSFFLCLTLKPKSKEYFSRAWLTYDEQVCVHDKISNS